MHSRSYVVTGIPSEVCRTERVAHYQTVDNWRAESDWPEIITLRLADPASNFWQIKNALRDNRLIDLNCSIFYQNGINLLKTKATFPEFLRVSMRKHTVKFKFPISLFVFSVLSFVSWPLRVLINFVRSAKAPINNSFCFDRDKLSCQLVKIGPLEPWLGQSQPMMLIRRDRYFTTYKVNWRSIAGRTVHFVFTRGPQYQDISSIWRTQTQI